MELFLILIVFSLAIFFLIRRRMYFLLTALVSGGGWLGCMAYLAVTGVSHNHFVFSDTPDTILPCDICRTIDRVEILANVLLLIAAAALVLGLIRTIMIRFRNRSES